MVAFFVAPCPLFHHDVVEIVRETTYARFQGGMLNADFKKKKKRKLSAPSATIRRSLCLLKKYRRNEYERLNDGVRKRRDFNHRICVPESRLGVDLLVELLRVRRDVVSFHLVLSGSIDMTIHVAICMAVRMPIGEILLLRLWRFL